MAAPNTWTRVVIEPRLGRGVVVREEGHCGLIASSTTLRHAGQPRRGDRLHQVFRDFAFLHVKWHVRRFCHSATSGHGPTATADENAMPSSDRTLQAMEIGVSESIKYPMLAGSSTMTCRIVPGGNAILSTASDVADRD